MTNEVWPPAPTGTLGDSGLSGNPSVLTRETEALRRRALPAIVFSRLEVGFQLVVAPFSVMILSAAFHRDNAEWMSSTHAARIITAVAAYVVIMPQLVFAMRWWFLAYKNLPLVQKRATGISPQFATAMILLPFLT